MDVFSSFPWSLAISRQQLDLLRLRHKRNISELFLLFEETAAEAPRPVASHRIKSQASHARDNASTQEDVGEVSLEASSSDSDAE